MTDRKGSDARQDPAQNDDPLFELARIVSGRGAGAAAPASSSARGRPAPPPAPAKPAPAEPNVLADLEAELLSDLQASFSAVRQAIEPSRPEAPPAPETRPPPAAAEPPPPAPAPVHVAPPPASPAQPASAPGHPSSEQHAPQPAPSRLSAAARPPIQQLPPHQPSAAAHPPVSREHAPPPAAAPPAAPPGAKKIDIGNLNLRPTTAPQVRVTAAPPAPTSPDKPTPTAAKPSRWEKPAEPPKPQASAASRFAPPRAANQSHPVSGQPVPPPAVDEEDLPFGEGVPFAHEGENAGDEFPLDAFDIVPGYSDDAEVPPYPDDDLETPERRGVPRALVAVAGILALVLIGVLGFVMLRPGVGGGDAPPIITADAGPTKISPAESPSTGDGEPNKLIYDRVDSGSTDGPADTKLVTPGSDPIASVPSTDDSSSPIARVIMPGGPAPEMPTASDAGASGDTGDNGADVAMNAGDSAQSIGPRKVRTVVVRPDGTIVSSDAVPAEGDAPASVDATAAPTAEAPAEPSVPAVDDTAAIAGGQGGQELAITATPDAAGSPAAETPSPAATATAETPTPTPKPAPPDAATSDGNNGPLDLTPGNGKSTTQVASRTPGSEGGAVPLAAAGMMVQVSSQRSEDAARATFRDLQARYPSILGDYEANVQRVDLGDRGVYFRVRVGPFASDNAQSLCSQIKSAGGDCILARN
jgi:hypothetical protein